MSVSATPIRSVEEVVAPRPHTLLRMDPLLMLGALGLAACSLITLKGATRTLDAGHPLYFVERQAVYFGIGLAVALVLARLDYSRLREYKYGLYGVMIALNLVVIGMPKVQGAARWIPLPFFQLQSSEFGKILLIVSVSAFAVDRSREQHALALGCLVPLNEVQQAVVNLRLGQLAALERDEIFKEYNGLREQIRSYEAILASEKRLKKE